MGRMIPIKPEWDRLTQKAVEATNLGTTYGKLEAARFAASQGDYIQQNRLFDDYLQHKEKNRRKKKLAEIQEDAAEIMQHMGENHDTNTEKTCPWCGKIVIGRRIYCNNYCRYMYRRKMEGK